MAFRLSKTKLFGPIWATMAPKMEETLELITNKTPLVQNEKTHLRARNVE